MSKPTDSALIEGYAEDAIRIPDHTGDNYRTVLERLHSALHPSTYLEIGTHAGASLSLARCSSIAIDPKFALETNVFGGKRRCHLFQMASDEFFAEYDPIRLFGRPIQFAFLDGMHWSEFLLRDFINTEKFSSNNSVIAIHDCIPLDIYSARRNVNDTKHRDVSRHPDWWAGDVWKLVRILKEWREDLNIYALDAQPTGLILVTNLDPKNASLKDHYSEITAAMQQLELADLGIGNYVRSLPILPTALMAQHEQISRYFAPAAFGTNQVCASEDLPRRLRAEHFAAG